MKIFRNEKYYRQEGTYSSQICDLCGMKRNCDYWVNADLMHTKGWIGFDACRSCARKLPEAE